MAGDAIGSRIFRKRQDCSAQFIDLSYARVFGIRYCQTARENLLAIARVKLDHSAAVRRPPHEIRQSRWLCASVCQPHRVAAKPPRRARTARPTVDRLTPIFPASSSWVASGCAATSVSTFAHSSGGNRLYPFAARPASRSIVLPSAFFRNPPHRRVAHVAERARNPRRVGIPGQRGKNFLSLFRCDRNVPRHCCLLVSGCLAEMKV